MVSSRRRRGQRQATNLSGFAYWRSAQADKVSALMQRGAPRISARSYSSHATACSFTRCGEEAPPLTEVRVFIQK